MSEYKERIWALVIASGAAVKVTGDDPWMRGEDYVSYYGACIKYDLDESVAAHKALTAGEIDWERTEDPVQDFAYGFAGTFTDHQQVIHYLYGQIVTKANESFYFAMGHDEGMSFSNILRMVLSNPPTLEDALAKLQAKIDVAIEQGKGLRKYGGDEETQYEQARDLFKHVVGHG